MLESEEEEPLVEVLRQKTRRARKSPFAEELEPWSRTAKVRSEQTSADASSTFCKADRPVAVNRFLATVKTAAHSRTQKKRSKMSLRDEPTFCFDQHTSKQVCPEDSELEPYVVPPKIREKRATDVLMLTQNDVADGRRSNMKHRIVPESSHLLTRNTITLNSDFERAVNTNEQDLRFRSNLQKLLKLRENVRKKKLSVVERSSQRPTVDIRQTRTHMNLSTKAKMQQVPLTTIDHLDFGHPSFSEEKHRRQPNKNCFLMTYKFIREKSKERQQKQHRCNLDSKLSEINKLINCIRQHGVEYSQLLGHTQQFKDRLLSRDRHRPN